MNQLNFINITIMNSLRNNVQLIGRLGNDPELRTFESGSKKTTFSLATSDSFTNQKGEKVENTEWHNIVVWGKAAELIEEYCKKGNEIAIQGKLTNRKYEKDGITKYITEINLSEFHLMSKPQA
jgi:single-strand DNA-binding protein